MAEPDAPSLAAVLAAGRARLAGMSRTPDLDARLLAAAALGLSAARMVLDHAVAPDAEGVARFDGWLERRAAGEPVHRILGRRAFYDHEFELSPETLEPRPDTEILVDLAARVLRRRGTDAAIFADLGTGTGAIGVSLLALFPQARCVAVDLAPGALVTARRNAVSAGVGARFHPLVGDYLAALGGPLDMIVANPPYIPTHEITDLSPEVRDHDPLLALDGGNDGLKAYRAIARGLWGKILVRDVLVEIGTGQGNDVAAIFRDADYDLAEVAADLAGHDRALWFRNDSGTESAENA